VLRGWQMEQAPLGGKTYNILKGSKCLNMYVYNRGVKNYFPGVPNESQHGTVSV